MSFLMFGVKFYGSKDSFEEGSKKMDEVCLKIGVLFLREWIDYWIKEGKATVQQIGKKTLSKGGGADYLFIFLGGGPKI